MEGIAPASKGDFAVKLLGPEGFVGEGIFHLEDLGGSCKLTLSTRDAVFNATSSDFFDALIQIRRRLEKLEILPLCYGASRDVYPTDLSRAMAQGLMAPRWDESTGKPGELVFIFHTGPNVRPVMVSEQRHTHQRCVAGQALTASLEPEPGASKLAA